MSKDKDYHAQGEIDRSESRNTDFIDILVRGGSDPHYNPPSDSNDRAEYDKGWTNAGK
jgi:hypothetical protein